MMRFTFLILVFCVHTTLYSQEVAKDETEIFFLIDSLAENIPGLRDTVEVNLVQTELEGFLTALGRGHNLNIGVSPLISGFITATFSNEEVRNILKYVIAKYDLDVELYGAIIEFTPRKPPLPMPSYEIIYDQEDSLLTISAQNANFRELINEIIKKTEINIVLNEKHGALAVTGLVVNEKVFDGLRLFAMTNNLTIDSLEGGDLLVRDLSLNNASTSIVESPNKPENRFINESTIVSKKDGQLNLSSRSSGNQILVSLDAYEVEVQKILEQVFVATGVDHFFLEVPEGKKSVVVRDMPLKELLSYLLLESAFEYRLTSNGEYIIGKSLDQGVRSTEVISLQYRKVSEFTAAIPKELVEGLEIIEFPELNSLIISGSQRATAELKSFVNMVDKPVPVVLIELIIIDILDSDQFTTGVRMGLAEEPVETTGTIGPGIDATFSGNSINEFFNGIGLGGLGRLTPNFYLTLTALETEGHIKINSTPRLATLNSHEATLNIGETSYYLEQRQNVVGTQNPQTIITNEFKPITADFSIILSPFLSGDGHITLDISVSQSNFTQRISPQAPPGQSTRSFQSSIRVKNGETIVLGGLERQEVSRTSEGVPFLSKIPVLNLLFSNRDRRKSNSKLAIFIKPIIIG